MKIPPAETKLDLHGLSATDAIEKFVQEYNARVRNGQLGCWTVVHGYGSSGAGGVIRAKLRAFLEQHQDKLKYDAGDQFGNPGWTWIYPKADLPDAGQRLSASILEFCSIPKTEEKILREFADVTGMQIKVVIRSMVKQGTLQTITKSGRIHYAAVR